MEEGKKQSSGALIFGVTFFATILSVIVLVSFNDRVIKTECYKAQVEIAKAASAPTDLNCGK